MKVWILVVLASLAAAASAQCGCKTMKWATCEGAPPSCNCHVMVGDGQKQTLDCEKLVPKCFLMKAEMYRARKGLSTRTGGKPVESAFVDNDGIYDPECENDGKFKAKQCNNTEQCWCVNSAGVRRTDKGDKELKCEKLVETYWVRLQLTHKEMKAKVDETKLKGAISAAIKQRYSMDESFVKEIKYDPEARLIVVDVNKEKGERMTDLSRMAYYMEKDVKVLPLFTSQETFSPQVDGQKLEMENILVYYVDEENPTFTMKNLPAGIIATIVVVVVVVVAGLLALVFLRKRLSKRYSKAQQREMEPM
ncbi:epithelial cell adhesion molecule [Cololabis saira]|uniref:epithelial cell adhesion molecule n=1 Tax=Cololabis saira TaxID=129043 RepID=UPI002AD28B28|nr:epithelial cell adhesion molecule [Cololabis saira]